MSPAPRPRRLRSTRADQERFPCSLIDRSAEEAPDSTPATSLRLPRSSTSPQPPLNQTKSLREFPNPPPEDGRHRVRVASGPYPPGSSRCDLEGRKRRFLTYAFPPRSPGPHHLAALTRPGFVGAACHPNPGISQASLPPASQSCCDRTTVEVSHLHSINVHFTAHSFAITIDLAAKPLGAIQ
jgi:hypothetical protein